MTAVAAAISATAEAVASMLIFSVLSLPVVPAAQYRHSVRKGVVFAPLYNSIHGSMVSVRKLPSKIVTTSLKPRAMFT